MFLEFQFQFSVFCGGREGGSEREGGLDFCYVFGIPIPIPNEWTIKEEVFLRNVALSQFTFDLNKLQIPKGLNLIMKGSGPSFEQ